MQKHRLTHGKSCAALTAARGFVRLGRSPTARFHASLHPQFASPGLASQALIRAGKPSFTLNVRRNIIWVFLMV